MNKNRSRRDFLKQNSVLTLGAAVPIGLTSPVFEKLNIQNNPAQIDRIENEIILHGRRNNQAWFEPAVGVIPGNKNENPQVFVRATLLTGNDIGPQFYLKTDDLGRTWSNPILCQNWFKVPMEDDLFEEPWFGFFFHSLTNKFMAIGQTHFVQDAGSDSGQKNESHYRLSAPKSGIVYSLWNPVNEDFEPWLKMRFPENLDLGIYYNGQFHENEDGTILIPGYYGGARVTKGGYPFRRVTMVKCRFDGRELHYLEHGSIHSVEEVRGIGEPSVIFFKGKYFMTIRHDLRAYVTSSEDGLHFSELVTWRFDDGEDLGNYNTQQKWLKYGDRLYLVYNRKSELNRGVLRSRAPLFMAEVDTERLRVRRNTERIVFPEKGARMGNFNMAHVTKNESWIITGEWLVGMFPHTKKGDRFWVKRNDINYMQYIGDLLLAKVFWE